jgi:hypothetical protein
VKYGARGFVDLLMGGLAVMEAAGTQARYSPMPAAGKHAHELSK